MPGGRRPSLPDPFYPARTLPARHPATGGEAALSPGPPPPHLSAAFHRATQQPVGRRPRAAPLAVAPGFGPTPSRCAARLSAGVRADALALRCSPSGIDPGAGSRSLECLAVQCSGNLGHLANVVPRPRAALRLAGSETRITGTHVAHRGLYIEGLVGTIGPQARTNPIH